MINKGAWVRIHRILLTPEQRAPQVPEDTRRVPLELWVKGWLLTDAEPGAEVEIETAAGRRERGVLLMENHAYGHSFGAFIPELPAIDRQVRDIVFGGGQHE